MSEDFRITIKKVLFVNIVVEEVALVWAKQCVGIFLDCVSPRLEALARNVDDHFFILGASLLLDEGRLWQWMVGEWHPADGFKQVWTTKKFAVWIWNSTAKHVRYLPVALAKGSQAATDTIVVRREMWTFLCQINIAEPRQPFTEAQEVSRSLSTPQKSNDSYDTKLRQEQICSLFDISFVGARHRLSLCFCFHFSKTIFFYCYFSSSLQIAKTVRLLGQSSVKRKVSKGKMMVISN